MVQRLTNLAWLRSVGLQIAVSGAAASATFPLAAQGRTTAQVGLTSASSIYSQPSSRPLSSALQKPQNHGREGAIFGFVGGTALGIFALRRANLSAFGEILIATLVGGGLGAFIGWFIGSFVSD